MDKNNMLELRILSGVHRGAILSLDEGIQTIYKVGSYEYADMLIVDPGILNQHFELRYENQAWFLYAYGEIREEDGQFLISPKALLRLQRMYVAGIWLGFADEDDAWEVLEPIPSSDFLHDKPVDIQNFLAQNTPSIVQTGPELLQEPASKVDVKSRMLAMIGLLSLAGWATANVFLTDVELNPRQAAELVEKTPIKTTLPANLTVKKMHSRQELAEIFDQKMIALDLKKQLSYEYMPDGWVIHGAWDEEDYMRLERAIEAFTQMYQPKFAIHIRNIPKKELLNIQVAQVIYGKLAGIVTQNGERIFIGDEINGYRLIAIQNQKAIFDGPQKIELSL